MFLLQVYGAIENSDGYERFVFSNSYSQVHQPPEVIRPDGIFFSFVHYNVEIRKRVKCITAIEGKAWADLKMSGYWLTAKIYMYHISKMVKYRSITKMV